MKYIILALTLLVVSSTSAFASPRGHGVQALDIVNKNNSLALSGSKSNSSSKSGSQSGAESLLNVSGTKVPNQAPSFGIGTMFPTAPCQGTKGGGFSMPWGGAALSGSHTLDECEIRETIRTTIHMEGAGIDTGNIAQELLCKTQQAMDTKFCKPFREAEAKAEEGNNEASNESPTRKVKIEDWWS